MNECVTPTRRVGMCLSLPSPRWRLAASPDSGCQSPSPRERDLVRSLCTYIFRTTTVNAQMSKRDNVKVNAVQNGLASSRPSSQPNPPCGAWRGDAAAPHTLGASWGAGVIRGIDHSAYSPRRGYRRAAGDDSGWGVGGVLEMY